MILIANKLFKWITHNRLIPINAGSTRLILSTPTAFLCFSEYIALTIVNEYTQKTRILK